MNKTSEFRPDGSRKPGILFDLDGVLWDSAPAHAEAFNQAFAEAHLPPLVDYTAIAGMKTEEAVLTHLERHALPKDTTIIRAITSRKRELALTFLRGKAKLAPGLNETLRHLNCFYRLALCTSASPGTVACFMEKSGLLPIFETVVDGTCVEHAKPAPDIYLIGARLLNLVATEVWVIEDSWAGVAAGCSAGMNVIGVGENVEALRSWGCQAVIPNIGKLPEVLGGMSCGAPD